MPAGDEAWLGKLTVLRILDGRECGWVMPDGVMRPGQAGGPPKSLLYNRLALNTRASRWGLVSGCNSSTLTSGAASMQACMHSCGKRRRWLDAAGSKQVTCCPGRKVLVCGYLKDLSWWPSDSMHHLVGVTQNHPTLPVIGLATCARSGDVT